MNFLTQSDYQTWCEHRNLQIKGRSILRPQPSKSVVLRVPQTTRHLLALICELFPERGQFDGGLFWVADFGSLSDDIAIMGQTILTLMRNGEPRSIDNAFASLFGNDERLYAQAFLSQLLLFGWGAY